jgi:hypothetical protein
LILDIFGKSKNVHFAKMAPKICQKTCRKHNAANAEKMKQNVAA